jgi:hypothetical protein
MVQALKCQEFDYSLIEIPCDFGGNRSVIIIEKVKSYSILLFRCVNHLI